MSRRSRVEKRLSKEEDTLDVRRAERKEQQAMAEAQRVEGPSARAQRALKRPAENDRDSRPERIARPGKPLKR